MKKKDKLNMKIKSETGFSVFEVLLLIVFGTFFALVGLYVLHHSSAQTTTVNLKPIADGANLAVTGIPNPTQLYANVNEATAFAAADDNSYIRGLANTNSSYDTVKYGASSTSGIISAAVINYRASQGTAQGHVVAQLYNGSTLIATGPSHTLGAPWSNISDTFNNLSLPSSAELQTRIIFTRTAGNGALRYSLIWLSVSVSPTTPPPPPPPPPPPSGKDPVITAAGDIACDPTNSSFNGLNGTSAACQMKATSNLVLSIKPAAALTLGDNQYESGTLANFLASYDKTWGRFKNIIKPAIGNHEGGEGQTHSNAGYFDYFNGKGVQTGAAGDRSKGYYSYNVGSWHLIALNSNCGTYWFNGVQTGCQAGSPQETWLRNDLATHSNVCTLAYWHIPRFSSGSSHHNSAATDRVYTTFWNDLYNAKADVILNGHDHDYERFAPQQPNGTADATNGIREFISGTGGINHYSFSSIVQNSQFRNATSFGVLKMTLHPASYDWQFINTQGTIVDSGTANCH